MSAERNASFYADVRFIVEQVLSEKSAEGRQWFVVDHEKGNSKLRGPYNTEAEAFAVRTEMERSEEENRNLWIVWEDAK